MNHKEKLHVLLDECSQELLAFVREREPFHQDRWVPAVEIKAALQLNFIPYPKSSKQYGAKGWLFAILARMLEEKGTLEYKNEGNRSYCRSAQQ